MEIPQTFYCPISHQLMANPVITTTNGISYEEKYILEWLNINQTCPVTSTPLTKEQLKPNRALKDTIESMMKLMNDQKINVPKKLKVSHDTIRVNTSYNDNHILVSLIPPDGQMRQPTHIVLINDVSGSMCTDASIKNQSGESESYGLTILDVVKHANRAIIENMESFDKLTIIAYSSSARVVLQSEYMDDSGKQKAHTSLDTMYPNGSTNLWDGLHTGLSILAEDNSIKNSSIFILTDGQPNIIPPRGHLPMLQNFQDEHPELHCSINTFGFGYNLDSQLLLDLSVNGNGIYGFIPESSFVGTIFVHALANVLTTKYTNVNLKIELDSSIDKTEIDVLYPTNKTSWGLDISVGSIRYGQTIDVLIPVSLTSEQLSKLRGQLVLKDIDNGKLYEISINEFNNTDNGLIQLQKVRNEIVNTIKFCIKSGNLESSRNVITGLINRIRSSNINDNYITALLKDVEGQVMEAFSKSEFYNKWGKHYLPSLYRSHELQTCSNFKDPGVQMYGGSLFKKIRDEADKTFCNLPPPKPTGHRTKDTPVLRSMATYSQPAGPCFDGSCLALMADNTLKMISNIIKGDEIYLPGGGSTKVVCVIKTIIQNRMTELVKLDGELLITPWHPVRIKGWQFPANLNQILELPCNAVFNFVLEDGHIMIINGVECVTLGHNFKEDVVSHPFFGTDKVINNLKKFPTWDSGLVTLKSGCMKRNSKTGLVNKLV